MQLIQLKRGLIAEKRMSALQKLFLEKQMRQISNFSVDHGGYIELKLIIKTMIVRDILEFYFIYSIDKRSDINGVHCDRVTNKNR